MFNKFEPEIKEIVEVILAGDVLVKGKIIDQSSEILVLYTGKEYLYISFEHIQNISTAQQVEDIQSPITKPEYFTDDALKELSLSDVLTQAIGMYTEVNVMNRQPLHGVIVNVMKDYFVFHSPIYKTMYISTKHLKWIIPHTEEIHPYGLTKEQFYSITPNHKLADQFDLLIKSKINKLVVINLGFKGNHTGLIKNLLGKMVEVQTGENSHVFLNIEHIKVIHEISI
ncbi:hypothetical protein [Ureibacillus manganicus]|uniref:DUF2642 domain-containing protein n=1 Tax=Ureibacillus manganicus DSM 26584 TaxID=1384049 RepID=A0A0A3IU24_9BACL|nr:hypothetical protein [Ureibacillus manganicus]KGR78322.1 hypothetical protein CD29_11425 [Ureibacillus manganicus DSM 26584]